MDYLRSYKNTYERDTDERLYNQNIYPHVSVINYYDKIDNSFSEEKAIKSMIDSIQYFEEYEDKFKLYDILTYNTTQQKLKCYHSPEAAKNSGETLIGICVIPEGFLPDGDARFMAFSETSKMWGNITDTTLYNTIYTLYNSTSVSPDNKWFDIQLYSPQYNYLVPKIYLDESEYEKWKKLPIINTDSSKSDHYELKNYVVRTVEYYGFLPSDEFTFNGTESWFLDCGYSNKTDRYYYGQGNSNATYENYMPSPYLLNGKLNQLYLGYCYGENPTSINDTCMRRFDGREKTQAIVKAVYEADNWLKDIGYSSKKFSDNNAALYCFNYNVNGTLNGIFDSNILEITRQSDWYLPSIAELGFLCVRKKAINDVITKLGLTSLLSASGYWSSSQYSTYYAYNLRFINGYVYTTNKYNALYVRPFLRKKKTEILS